MSNEPREKSIAAANPRGGLNATLNGKDVTLLLRMGEIERWEAVHRGIFAMWDALMAQAAMPTSREVRDLLALALIGGGMPDAEADRFIMDVPTSELMNMAKLAQAALAAALLPTVADAFEQDPDMLKKNPDLTDMTFSGLSEEHPPPASAPTKSAS